MKVKFHPTNEEFEIQPNQSVLDLAQKNGVFIKTICNGNASCAECRIKIKDGEQNVISPAAKELALIGTGYFIDQRRLACQLKCFGDVTVDITEQLDRKNAGPKKVLGNRKMEADSHAESSILMSEEHDLVEQVEARVEQREKTDQRRHHQGSRQQNNQGGGGNKRNNNRRRRRHKKSNNQQQN